MTITQTGAFDVVRFEDQASDTTPFVIDQNGNVGIGTTAPGYKLDVAGSVNIGSNSHLYFAGGNPHIESIYDDFIFQVDTDNNATGRFFFKDTNTDVMTIVNGNVGIGTTAPTAKLDITGDASSSGSLVLRGTSPTTLDILNGGRFDIQTSVGGDAGLTPRLTITSNGNVGIGTTGPA
ncbi:MAG: hypothetical protein KatS3mg089_0922 [Patescibacteria group bacterium]|nr:MAG: hypothetical protein KatS3mg089_0922 [Patescibacteria group bacterium]